MIALAAGTNLSPRELASNASALPPVRDQELGGSNPLTPTILRVFGLRRSAGAQQLLHPPPARRRAIRRQSEDKSGNGCRNRSSTCPSHRECRLVGARTSRLGIGGRYCRSTCRRGTNCSHAGSRSLQGRPHPLHSSSCRTVASRRSSKVLVPYQSTSPSSHNRRGHMRPDSTGSRCSHNCCYRTSVRLYTQLPQQQSKADKRARTRSQRSAQRRHSQSRLLDIGQSMRYIAPTDQSCARARSSGPPPVLHRR